LSIIVVVVALVVFKNVMLFLFFVLLLLVSSICEWPASQREKKFKIAVDFMRTRRTLTNSTDNEHGTSSLHA
jgi:hypothetical protein